MSNTMLVLLVICLALLAWDWLSKRIKKRRVDKLLKKVETLFDELEQMR